MVMWKILTWISVSMLTGMKSACGIDCWKGMEGSFSRVCQKRQMYEMAGIWFFLYGLIWIISGKSLVILRLTDLLYTYGILAIVDSRRKIVPNEILICYFVGQMLLGICEEEIGILLYTILTGVVFSGLLWFFVWISRGKMGMGDIRLIGVTAMTAGWSYTAQILFFAMGFSFIYSIGLLICRKSVKTEFPFVPFLAAGMVIQLIRSM